jgi:hypothetical protein
MGRAVVSRTLDNLIARPVTDSQKGVHSVLESGTSSTARGVGFERKAPVVGLTRLPNWARPTED